MQNYFIMNLFLSPSDVEDMYIMGHVEASIPICSGSGNGSL